MKKKVRNYPQKMEKMKKLKKIRIKIKKA